jgi:spore coat protein U-like protein
LLKAINLLCVALVLLLGSYYAEAACTVTTTSVNLGEYNTLFGASDSTGSITINCDVNSSVVTSIGPGVFSGGFVPRKMKNTTLPDTLNYNLYTTAARITIWGDGTQGTSTVGPTAIARNGSTTLTIYGRIPASQDVSAGQYTDMLVVTINF